MKTLIIILAVLILASASIGVSTNNNKSPDKNNFEKNNCISIKKISELIKEKRNNFLFGKTDLFTFEKSISENDNTISFVTNASIINLKKESLNQLLRSKEENLVLNIPLAKNKILELELTQSFPLSEDFTLLSINSSGKKSESYKPGLHYNGIIRGKENSIASISVFENFVMGIISDETGNYILGSIKNSDNSYSEKYIFYNDADMTVKNKFKCGVEDREEMFVKAIKEAEKHSEEISSNDNISTLPVKIYFEADYQMYVDGQNNTQNVSNFITGMFNSVKTIYQNESIPTVISSIGIWTGIDPYRNLTDPFDILASFGKFNQNDFQGNLAHLLSTRNAGLGGIAWIRVLCANYNPKDFSGRYAFSNIDPGYNNYPTYSWTVNVVTHEMGHSMGSRHTHSCVWPVPGGPIRAIDSCYNPEGNCFTTQRPRVGTIMSYCHLFSAAQGGGINLSFGFGQLPGDTIRLRYSQAGCLRQELNSSEMPSSFDLAQNFPNPFNPSTVIRFALPKESLVTLKVYDVNGRLVATLIENKIHGPGFYEKSFNSSAFLLSSGIYFYKLETKDFTEVKRMVLVK